MQSQYLLPCFLYSTIIQYEPTKTLQSTGLYSYRPRSTRVGEEEEVGEVGVVTAPGPRHQDQHQEEEEQDEAAGGQRGQPPGPPGPGLGLTGGCYQ